MRLTALLVAIALAAACATAPPPEPATQAAPAPVPAATPSSTAQLDALLEAYFEETLELNPLQASSIGDDRYNHLFAVNISDEHRAREKELAERTLAALQAIDQTGLDPQRRLSLEMLRGELRTELQRLQFPEHLIPLNQFYSTPSLFAQLGSGTSLHPFRTAEDYDDFLGRLSGFERWIDTAIANMRRGMAEGVVQPRVLMERVIPQLEAHIVDDPEKSLFWEPVRNLPAGMAAADRERITATYRSAISNRIIPSYRKLRDFVRDDYIPRARTAVGMSALPNGDAWYRANVRSITTTDLTPQQIHDIGLAEVARIHREMESVKASVGFKGDLEAFFAHVENDPTLRFKSKEELLTTYRQTKQRIDATVPKLFDIRPAADYEIRPVEPFRERSASNGSYVAAAPDGSRPGIFFVNTYDLKARPKIDVTSLSLHEGAPGHHFQISVQRELGELPRFRRFGGYTAYVEGWGLYAESLGTELGLYDTDPYQKFGGLSAELWRSIRLVLDTGIHTKGWTREQAIEYGQKNSSLNDTRIISEVERFIAIPGQALAYKVGQLKITELRRRAEQALGERFDVKAFHREVLSDGALPLDLLETKMQRWIDAQRGT
jgi:uncharacterized protein (DUF885 family)